MEFTTRKSINDNLHKYCYLSNDDDFIEITQWSNGEGYDINISRKNENKLFSLTYGEIEAIKYLIQSLDYNK